MEAGATRPRRASGEPGGSAGLAFDPCRGCGLLARGSGAAGNAGVVDSGGTRRNNKGGGSAASGGVVIKR